MGATGYQLVINDTTVRGMPVKVTNIRPTFYPPPRMGPEAQCTFVRFTITWRHGQEGQGFNEERHFVAKLADRILPLGTYKFDMVVTGDVSDGEVALMVEGAQGTHSPDIKISHARENGEERDLYMTKECCM